MIDALPPEALAVLFFVMGLVMGSFGNVLIYRVPERRSVGGRSHCPGCGKTLRVWELIPVLSFLFLRGKCARCKKPLSWQYPLIELLSGILFILALYHAGAILPSILLALCFWLLLLMAVIDMRHAMIPDSLNLPFAVCALLYSFLTGTFSVWGFVLCIGFFGLQWLISRGMWLGSGDVILSIGIGALVSTWPMALLFLGISYISGALIAVLLILLKKKTRKDMVPFGQFMALSAIVTVFFGDRILAFLLHG